MLLICFLFIAWLPKNCPGPWKWLSGTQGLKLFGPVLFYDMIRTARRRRHTVLRLGYAFLLVYVLAIIYLVTVEERVLEAKEDLSNQLISESGLRELTLRFFGVFMAIQMLAVLILTPAYTGGAVAAEKERQTLYDLLATDLRNREIVLSLLVSRLANLGLVIITGVPILGFLEFLGGLDPHLVLTGFAVTGVTSLSLGALGILNSVLYSKPRTAILRTYFWILFYLALSGLSWLLLLPTLQWADFPSTESWQSPVTLERAVKGFNVGNPVAALVQIELDLKKGIPMDTLVWEALIPYAWFHGILAMVCVLWSIRRIRVLALRQMGDSDSDTRVWKRRSAFHLLPVRFGIGAWPMLWKEMGVEASARRRWLGGLGLGIVLAGCFLPVVHLVFWMGNLSVLLQWLEGVNEIVNFWVRCMTVPIGSLMLILVGVRAAGSITGERARRTLDGLLTTPLEPRGILFAKWWAAILSPRRARFWLLLIWILGMVTGALHPLALLGLGLAWTVYAAFMASLGLYFSVASKSTQRAVMWTLVTSILVFGAFILLAFDFSSGRFEAYGVVPVVALAIIPSFGREFQPGTETELVHYSSIVVGLFLWGGIAIALGLLASYRFRVDIGRNRKPTGPVDGEGKPMESIATIAQLPSEPNISRKSKVGLKDLLPVSLQMRDWFFSLRRAWPLAIPGLLLVGWYGYQSNMAAKALETTIAETDRLDPGWRLEDLEARRARIPDEKNSALQVLRAERSLPGSWSSINGTNTRLDERFHIPLNPEEQLQESQTQVLIAELKKLEVPLGEARRLAEMPTGRFPPNDDPRANHFWFPHLDKIRHIETLLGYDILLLAQQGKMDAAVDSCRALINAGRSLGHEPSLMAQWHQFNLKDQAPWKIERVLAQGAPSASALLNLQSLLERDADEPLFLQGLRGERAMLFQLLQDLQNGHTKVLKEFGWFGPGPKNRFVNSEALQLMVSSALPHQRAALLQLQNHMVEIAKLPLEQQSARFNQLSLPFNDFPLVSQTLIPHSARIGDTFRRLVAKMRSALVMVAVERFREAHQRWPNALEELVPLFLEKIPDDPYTGTPLLYRRPPDGVVIYSVGPDGVDNGGNIRPTKIPNALVTPGTDIGVRLWDPAHRRQKASTTGNEDTDPAPGK